MYIPTSNYMTIYGILYVMCRHVIIGTLCEKRCNPQSPNTIVTQLLLVFSINLYKELSVFNLIGTIIILNPPMLADYEMEFDEFDFYTQKFI